MQEVKIAVQQRVLLKPPVHWLCRAVLEAMLILVRSTYPLLELRGAQGLARLTSKAPFFCPTPRATLASCKRHLARQGAMPALLSELALLCACL